MKKPARFAILFIVGCAAAAAGVYFNIRQDVIPLTSTTNNALFAVSLPDANGQSQSMAQWKGKVLVVNFWATWCTPCLKEIPDLIKIHTATSAKNVQIVGIALDSFDNVRQFSRSHAVPYPLLIGTLDTMELLKNLGNNSGALPYTVIIGTDGIVAERHLGALTEAQLMGKLAKYLPGTL